MPNQYDRRVVAYLSCTHAGHELGLLNPETWFPEYHYHEDGTLKRIEKVYRGLTPTQETLWNVFTSHVDEMFYIAGEDPFGVIHLGDATQGVKYMDGVVFSSEGDQTVLAVNNWKPFFSRKNKPEFARLVWGTPSHRFNRDSVPMKVHTQLKALYPEVDIKTYRHGLVTVGGVKGDIAHQGASAGIRNWTDGNAYELYCKSLVMDDMDREKSPPDLIVRSHFHVKVERYVVRWRGIIRYKTCCLLIPPYQMITNYAHQRSRSPSKLIIGMAVVEIINGKIHDVHWLTKEFELRIEEVLS